MNYKRESTVSDKPYNPNEVFQGAIDVKRKDGSILKGYNVETGNAVLYNPNLTEEEKAEIRFRQELNNNVNQLINKRVNNTLEMQRAKLREIEAEKEKQETIASMEKSIDPAGYDYKYAATRPSSQGEEELAEKEMQKGYDPEYKPAIANIDDAIKLNEMGLIKDGEIVKSSYEYYDEDEEEDKRVLHNRKLAFISTEEEEEKNHFVPKSYVVDATKDASEFHGSKCIDSDEEFDCSYLNPRVMIFGYTQLPSNTRYIDMKYDTYEDDEYYNRSNPQYKNLPKHCQVQHVAMTIDQNGNVVHSNANTMSGFVNPIDANGEPIYKDINFVTGSNGKQMRCNANYNLDSPTVQMMFTQNGVDLNECRHVWARTLMNTLRHFHNNDPYNNKYINFDNAKDDLNKFDPYIRYILPSEPIVGSYNADNYVIDIEGLPSWIGSNNPNNGIKYVKPGMMAKSTTDPAAYPPTEASKLDPITGLELSYEPDNNIIPFGYNGYNNYNYINPYGGYYNYGGVNFYNGYYRVYNDKLNRPDNPFTGNTGYNYEVYGAFGETAEKMQIQKMKLRLKMSYTYCTGKKLDDETATKMVYDYMNPKVLQQKQKKLTKKELRHIKNMENINLCRQVHEAGNRGIVPITRDMFFSALDTYQIIQDKNRFKGRTVAQFLNEDLGILLRDMWEQKHITSWNNKSFAGTYDSYYYNIGLARYKMEHDPEMCKRDPYAMALLSDTRYSDGFDLSKYLYPGETYATAPLGPDGKPIGTFNNLRLGWDTEESMRRKEKFMELVKKRVYEAQLIKANRKMKKGK